MSKGYRFRSPSGHIVRVTNIAALSRKHGLDASHMSKVHLGKRSIHKGWTA